MFIGCCVWYQFCRKDDDPKEVKGTSDFNDVIKATNPTSDVELRGKNGGGKNGGGESTQL